MSAVDDVYDVVWQTVTESLPTLLVDVKAIIERESVN